MAQTVRFGNIEIPVSAKKKETQHLIPALGDYEPQGKEMQALALADLTHQALILTGETGTGKNAAIRDYCAKVNKPLIVVSLAAGTTSDQFIGVPMPLGLPGGGFTVAWQDGALPTAIKMGACLVLDELNAADDRTLMRLNDFMANDFRLNVYENPETHGADIITPFLADGSHNGFMLVATMNPAESGKYSGTKMLNEALLDRFLVHYMDYLGLSDPDKEAAAVARIAKVKVAKAKRIVEVMNAIRRRSRLSETEIGQNGTQPIYATASTRRAVMVAIASKHIPMMQAIELAFTNKVNGDDQPVVHKMFLDAFASDAAAVGAD